MRRARRAILALLACAACGLQRGAFVAGRQAGALHGRGREVRLARSVVASASMEEVVKHPRLPVWPAWFGIVYIILDLITGSPKAGAFLEDKLGGRVCPMIFQESGGSDPFLLIAHHRHSFAFLDPFRYLFRFLLPEGFPAHPHRGFETVTYVLKGGLVHRDSFGVKKSYGAPAGSEGTGKDGAVQWMTAGRGLQHEEMWRTGGMAESSDQELFQIWVNLPASAKMVAPRMQMLGSSSGEAFREGGPEVRELGPIQEVSPKPGVTVRVIAGNACGVRSAVETNSLITILHITLEEGASWTWAKPQGWNCLLYTRRGEVMVGDGEELLEVHHTATMETALPGVVMRAGEAGADILLLSGLPLNESVEMGGNVVMNTPTELQEADRDLSLGRFGPSWRHTLDDEEWQEKVQGHWDRVRQNAEAAARRKKEGVRWAAEREFKSA